MPSSFNFAGGNSWNSGPWNEDPFGNGIGTQFPGTIQFPPTGQAPQANDTSGILDWLKKYAPYLLQGGGIATGLIGSILQSGALNRVAGQDQAYRQQMLDMAKQEQQRRGSFSNLLMPMLARDMHMQNPAILGQLSNPQIGANSVSFLQNPTTAGANTPLPPPSVNPQAQWAPNGAGAFTPGYGPVAANPATPARPFNATDLTQQPRAFDPNDPSTWGAQP